MIKHNIWIKCLCKFCPKICEIKIVASPAVQLKDLDWKEKWIKTILKVCADEYCNSIAAVVRKKMARSTFYCGAPVTNLTL